MGVSRRLRFEILRRDNYACRYCGAKAPDATLTVDHVVAVTLGGGDEPNNLVTACQPCNAGKSSTPADAQIVEDVDAAALLWARAMERAIAARREEINATDGLLDKFNALWNDLIGTAPDPRPPNWADSIERFLASGLVFADLWRAAHVALEARCTWSAMWRYFCGVCWKEIARRQELARTYLEDEVV